MDTKHDVSEDKGFEFHPVRFGVALSVDDAHLLDKCAFSRFTSTCEGGRCDREREREGGRERGRERGD